MDSSCRHQRAFRKKRLKNWQGGEVMNVMKQLSVSNWHHSTNIKGWKSINSIFMEMNESKSQNRDEPDRISIFISTPFHHLVVYDSRSYGLNSLHTGIMGTEGVDGKMENQLKGAHQQTSLINLTNEHTVTPSYIYYNTKHARICRVIDQIPSLWPTIIPNTCSKLIHYVDGRPEMTTVLYFCLFVACGWWSVWWYEDECLVSCGDVCPLLLLLV